MFKIAFIGALAVSGLTILIISWVFFHNFHTSGENKLAVSQFFLEWYKVAGLGFIIALLGAIVPHVLTEERTKFENFKNSREVYSQAKTSIMYLPETLASLDSYDDAIKKITEAHQNLHLAETYPKELRQHLLWLNPREETWVSRNYWELFAVRTAVNKKIDIWSSLPKSDRLTTFQESLTIVEENFGFNNYKWEKISKTEKEEIEKTMLAAFRATGSASPRQTDSPTKERV